jgi:hypothetical protein
VPQPLAKVVQDDALHGPRGPDGRHEIVVPEGWLGEGAWVEIPLPRLLNCAACEGGGCDRCERSGAVATRPRKTLTEVVELQLPTAPAILRVPRRGGLPGEEAQGLGRGVLLLAVRTGAAPSEGVRRIARSLAASRSSDALAPIAPPGLVTPGRFLWAAAALLAAGMAWLLGR